MRLLRATLARKQAPGVIAKIVDAAVAKLAGRKIDDYEQERVATELQSLKDVDDDDIAEASKLVNAAVGGRTAKIELLELVYGCSSWPDRLSPSALLGYEGKIDTIMPARAAARPSGGWPTSTGPQSDHLRAVLGIPGMHKAWSAGQESTLTDSEGRSYSVRDTDNPSDMLRLGTDIKTCQSIETGEINECLLGYLLDGKNRAIVIKRAADRHEPILARAVYRILRGPTGRIVLYIEKPYFSNQIEEGLARRAIVDMARARGGPAKWAYLDTGVGKTEPVYELLEDFTVQLGQFAQKKA